MNLEVFELNPTNWNNKIFIRTPKLKDNEDVNKLISKMNLRFGLNDNQELKRN